MTTAFEMLAPELVAAPEGDGDLGPLDSIHLRVSACAACDRRDFPARDTCPACSGPMRPDVLPREGVLVGSTAVLHQPPDALIEVPYEIGVARLGDIDVLGLLIGGEPGAAAPLGARVECVAVAVDDRTLTYGFKLI